MTVTQLRKDLYRILDRILETGQPLEIERKGRKLRIVPDSPASKLDRLQTRDCLVGDPEDLVHMDWSSEWRP